MRQMCKDSIFYHGKKFLKKGAMTTAFGYLWGLLQHRLCYDTHAQPTGRHKKVNTISANMARQIGQVLRAVLWCKCAKTRRKNFRMITWENLSVPFRKGCQKKAQRSRPMDMLTSPPLQPPLAPFVRRLQEAFCFECHCRRRTAAPASQIDQPQKSSQLEARKNEGNPSKVYAATSK